MRILLVGIMTLLAFTALFAGGLPWIAAFPAGLAVLLYAIHAASRHPWQSVDLREQGRAVLVDTRGNRITGSRDGNPFVSPWYIGFVIRTPAGARHRIGLFRDELASEDYRRLAAHLRMEN